MNVMGLKAEEIIDCPGLDYVGVSTFIKLISEFRQVLFLFSAVVGKVNRLRADIRSDVSGESFLKVLLAVARDPAPFPMESAKQVR